MKVFQNEVLTFDTTVPKNVTAMKQELAEWGAAGFEVVSAVPTWPGAGHVMVFLKREMDADENEKGAAA
jgi:hypothetical protein